MTLLETLQPDTVIRGIRPNEAVTVVSVQWHSTEALTLVYRGADGAVANEILYRHDEAVQIQVSTLSSDLPPDGTCTLAGFRSVYAFEHKADEPTGIASPLLGAVSEAGNQVRETGIDSW